MGRRTLYDDVEGGDDAQDAVFNTWDTLQVSFRQRATNYRLYCGR